MCPKWLLGDEYTGEFRLQGGEYTGKSTSLCTLNKHQNRFTKEAFWWVLDQGVKTPQSINHRESWLPSVFCTSTVLLWTNLGRLPGSDNSGESQPPGDEYTREWRLPSSEYNGESWLPSREYTGEPRLPGWIHWGVDCEYDKLLKYSKKFEILSRRV